MSEHCSSDFYELLELSPNASFDSIERMFRFHAKRFHPESGASGNTEKFKQIVLAYETLKDPAKRAAYDAAHQAQQQEMKMLVMGANATADDCAVRHRLLSLFYAQRKRNMKQPGVGIARLEELTNLTAETLDFHLWYFREKGWVQRETSGPLSITVAGVDEIESREKMRANNSASQANYSLAAPAARPRANTTPSQVAT